MDPLRYQAEIDPHNMNTSHGLVIDLVGRGKRVLDVGCATGDLDKILIGRGCDVIGIEPDGAAAEIAKQHLSQVLSVKIEELDLLETFGTSSFDAVIVADVLEHLQTPVEVLRQLSSILAPGGVIVASIPNVAHGAVRLALLEGRFDYTDVGLLDRTHIRFFTLPTVDQLFEDAGLVIVELRRTTAGIFETEIALRPESFDPSVLDAVTRDPEATTYQFVLRAVPEAEGREAHAQHRQREALRLRVHELEQEVARLQARLRPQAASLPGRGLQVGLWGFFDTRNPADSIRLAVHRLELSRRLPQLDLRAFAPFCDTDNLLEGAALERLGAATEARAAALAEELDAVVVIGQVTARADEIGRRYGDAPAATEHPAHLLIRAAADGVDRPFIAYSGTVGEPIGSRNDDRALLDALVSADLVATSSPVIAELVRQAGSAVVEIPDPLRLAGRLGDRRRWAALRGEHLQGGSRYILVRGGEEALSGLPRLLACLQLLRVEEPGIEIVVANVDVGIGEGACTAEVAANIPSAVQVLEPSVDLTVALVEGAAAVVTDADWLLELSAGFRVPTLSLARAARSTTLSDRSAILHLLASTPVAEDVEAFRLDRYFDDLAAHLERLSPRPRVPAWPLLAGRLEATEDAVRRLWRRKLELEEAAATVRVEMLDLRNELLGAERALAAAEERGGKLQQMLLARDEELASIHGSKLWLAATLWRRLHHLLNR